MIINTFVFVVFFPIVFPRAEFSPSDDAMLVPYSQGSSSSLICRVPGDAVKD